MADTTFSAGTVITSSWLNDVNDVVHTDLGGVGGLASTSDVTKGDAFVGVKSPLTGGTGRTQHQKNQDIVTPQDFGAVGDGTTNDTTAVQAALSSGREVDLGNFTYAVTSGLEVTGTIYSGGATFKFTSNVTTALELSANSNVVGKLTVDVSTISCTNGILLDGANQCTHSSAQRCDTIYLKGKDHTSSVNGLMLDSTIAGANNKAWVHYAKLRRIIVENFQKGCVLQASQASLTLSYVNANIIDELTLIGCKRNIIMSAASSSDISSNFIQRYVVQYGAVSGSFPTDGIEITGRCAYNRIEGFIYDWDHTNTTGPIVEFDATTFDNFVVSSAFFWEVSDLGLRNKYESALTPQQTNLWLSPHGRGFLGKQDNTLAHWSGTIGTVTGAASTSGTATVALAGGSSVLNLQKEDTSYTQLDFTSGTGTATYTIEFLSTTNIMNGMSVVGLFFEPTYVPNSIEVQIDVGAGYVARASFNDVRGNEVFCRLDSVGGTDIYNTVAGIKFLIQASDTRTVRIRQAYANGIFPSSYASRGGDRMRGDLRFPNGVGPVLVSPNSTEWRITVDNAGALGTTNSPTKVMTHF